MGVETGGCPRTAIREDASMNLAAIEDMNRKFPHAELCFVESGGDNLAATFSPELADLTVYVIDVAEGEKYLARVALGSRAPMTAHTVTSDGGGDLNSGSIDVGATWRHTFTQPGSLRTSARFTGR